MEDDLLLSSVLADSRRSYGSLRDPDFAFATRTYQQQPYKALVDNLSGFAEVRDNTHLDSDVCFYYEVSTASGSWHLLLSMVGPYAMLFRAPRAHWWSSRVVLTPIVDDFRADEIRIHGLFSEWGFTFLSGAQSKISVEFPEWPGGPLEKGPLFRILFSDVFDLAW
ncbi:hypothetical protein ACWC5I_03610 [Kitasatospora sp. NPDC001574]